MSTSKFREGDQVRITHKSARGTFIREGEVRLPPTAERSDSPYSLVVYDGSQNWGEMTFIDWFEAQKDYTVNILSRLPIPIPKPTKRGAVIKYDGWMPHVLIKGYGDDGYWASIVTGQPTRLSFHHDAPFEVLFEGYED